MPPRRKTWNKESMKLAVAAVKDKEMGYLKASKVFGVPKSTIEKYIRRGCEWEELSAIKLGRKPILPPNLEKALYDYCIKMDQKFYGLRKLDIKRMAYFLCEENGINHPFRNEEAGKKWLSGFLKRHDKLSMRTPQGLSQARIRGFTKPNCDRFYDLLEVELVKIKFNPARVFNVDETGICVVQGKHTKIISVKGKKQVGAIQSQERGKLITVVTCMNATGIYVPPLLVFPRVNKNMRLMNGTPAGSQLACHISGWIQAPIFTQWFEHFVKTVKPTAEDPVVVILDGQYSHTRNIDLINKARENFVTIVCLPPHSSHKMQSLDVAFMGPLKAYYKQEIESWLRNNPGKIVDHYEIGAIFGKAYNKAAGMAASTNGFRKTGIIPFSRNNFQDWEFTTTESEIAEAAPAFDTPTQGTSQAPTAVVTPEQISPYPVFSGVTSNRAGEAAIVTSTPFEKGLEEALKKKAEIEEKKKEKAENLKKVNQANPKSKKPVKRALFEESDSKVTDDEAISDEDDDGTAFTPESIKVDDFVLVQFATKKTVKHYVAIVRARAGDELEVSFLRKRGKSFVYPAVDDRAMVPTADVIAVLTERKKTETSRTKDLVQFKFKFSKFNVN